MQAARIADIPRTIGAGLAEIGFTFESFTSSASTLRCSCGWGRLVCVMMQFSHVLGWGRSISSFHYVCALADRQTNSVTLFFISFRAEYTRMPLLQAAVELESAKTDEDGQTIHEECYVSKNGGPDPASSDPYTSENR